MSQYKSVLSQTTKKAGVGTQRLMNEPPQPRVPFSKTQVISREEVFKEDYMHEMLVKYHEAEARRLQAKKDNLELRKYET